MLHLLEILHIQYMVWYNVKKCYLRPLYFSQKCPQNAGNAVSGTQNSKHFQGVMSPDPLQMCCYFTVRVHGPLLASNGKALK